MTIFWRSSRNRKFFALLSLVLGIKGFYKDGVKPATINRELAAMKKAFNLALKEWEWAKYRNTTRLISTVIYTER
ncbi:MAG: hypothetical protein ABSF48_15615 [Thermodesulfobacteriota bacterium]|jgi:hypothetical protein